MYIVNALLIIVEIGWYFGIFNALYTWGSQKVMMLLKSSEAKFMGGEWKSILFL